MDKTFHGALLALISVGLFSLLNIFFKSCVGPTINPLLFVSTAMLFGGGAMMLYGGKTTRAYAALKSKFTWLYALFFMAQSSLFLWLIHYVSATDAVLLSRFHVVISLVLGLVLLKRNTIGVGAWGLPFVLVGLVLVVMSVDMLHVGPVIFLAVGLSFAKSGYYVIIEMHDAVEETNVLTKDTSVIGYIVSVTGVLILALLFGLAVLGGVTSYHVPHVPTLMDFQNPYLFVNAFVYGVFGITILRFLEFKCNKILGSDIFPCFLTFTPLVTFVFEQVVREFAFYPPTPPVDGRMLLSMLLIITGGMVVVGRKYLVEVMHDQNDLKAVQKLVNRTLTHFKENEDKAAKALGIDVAMLCHVRDGAGVLQLKKLDARKIQERYNDVVSTCDALTGLINKMQFMTELKAARRCKNLSVLYLDLDKFKPINDAYGHDVGDFVLAEIATRLKNEVGEDGVVTRMGGDEFCVLLPNMPKAEAVQRVEDLQAAVEAPIVLPQVGVALSVGASIGVAGLEDLPESGDVEQLITLADRGMYAGKSPRAR